MTLIHQNIQNLEEIKNLLKQFSTDLYIHPKEILSQATIGQHFRHILEFYICIEKGAGTRTVCYDDRERDLLIETNVEYAINTLDSLKEFLRMVKDDLSLTLEANYSASSDKKTVIQTSLYRELAYVLDHAIHHLAIVKIALLEDKVQVETNFGVAASTIRYRKKCAQ